MIEFIQKQIEASERLFNVMKTDHNARMAEMEHWARTTQSLIEKLHERDMTISMLKNGKAVPDLDTPEDVSFENAERRMKIMEKQVEALAEQVKRLKDENEALRLDLGLKDHGQ